MVLAPSINDKAIVHFRNTINSNNNFVLNTYLNKNGKDQWSLICSSMNWITVAIRYLENFPALDTDPDIKAMQVYSIISSIDIVVEAILQLHRVIFDCKDKQLPFRDKNHIFKKTVFTKLNDDDYFKQIRACFGAHPVNLNATNSNNKEERLFASWPYRGHFNNDTDLQVQLYSNDPDTPDTTFGLSIKELIKYLKSRYEYIDIIAEEVIKQYQKKKEKLINTQINTGKDAISTIDILKNANILRFNDDEYRHTLNEIELILKTELAEPIYNKDATEFKTSLDPLIKEIQNNLQLVNIAELQHDYLLYPKSKLEQGLSYELPKLYSCIFHNLRKRDPLFSHYLERINTLSNNNYNLRESDSNGQLLLKLKLVFLNYP